MTSPESESNYSAYNTSVEFDTDLQPRLRNNPVFLKAQEVQYSFAATQLDEDKLKSFWLENEQIDALNAEVSSEGLDKHEMVLEGNEIYIPIVTMDIIRSTTTIKEGDDEYRQKKSFESTLSPYAIKGKYHGFSVRFKKIGDTEKYAPILCYKVSMGKVRTPQATMEYFATGDVGTTSINFDTDIHQDEVENLVESLKWFAPDTDEEVRSLVAALSKDKIEVEHISYAAYKAKEILTFADEDKKQLAEDALADLIQYYLNKTKKFTLKTRAYLKSQGDASMAYVHQKGAQRVFNESILDVTFMDQYEMTESGAKAIGQKAVYLVISEAGSDDYIYLPVHSIDEFAKK